MLIRVEKRGSLVAGAGVEGWADCWVHQLKPSSQGETPKPAVEGERSAARVSVAAEAAGLQQQQMLALVM